MSDQQLDSLSPNRWRDTLKKRVEAFRASEGMGGRVDERVDLGALTLREFAHLTGISAATLALARHRGESLPGVVCRKVRRRGVDFDTYSAIAWHQHLTQTQHPLSTSADGIGSIPTGARDSD